MDQKLKSEETRHLLLESAFRLFYREGYGATSIPAIAKEAGMSKGALYHHFNNKKELGEQMIAYVLKKRLYQHMLAPLENATGKELIPLLMHLFQERIDGFSDEEIQWGCPLNNLINEVGASEVDLQNELRALIENWKQCLVKRIEEAKVRREIRVDVDATATAVYLISAFEGVRGIAKLYQNKEMLQQYLIGLEAYLEQLR